MSVIDVILQRVDPAEYISEKTGVRFKKQGKCYRGICPICGGDNDQAFAVYPDKKVHCFKGCCTGNIINWVAAYQHTDFYGATEMLATELNIDLSTDEKYCETKNFIKSNEALAHRYHGAVMKVMDYMTIKRGLSPDTVKAYMIGADDNSMIIPMRDKYGRCVAFAKRYHDPNAKPKYKNSMNNDYGYQKHEFFFNLDRALKVMTDTVWVVEGQIDAMSGDEQLLPMLAQCGISLTKEQIIILSELAKDRPGFTVILLIDNDGKAYKTLPKVREMILQYAPEVNFRVGLMPEEEFDFPDGRRRKAKDANDLHLAKRDIADLKTESLDVFVLKMMLDVCKNEDAEYKAVESFIKTVKSQMVRLDLAKLLAKRWDKEEKFVRNYLEVSLESIEDVLSEFKDTETGIREFAEMLKAHGIKLGYPSIDAAVRGLRRGDVYFLGACPGVGKTFLAIEHALHMVLKQDMNVLFFSLEMSAGALYERIIANILGKSSKEIEEMMGRGDPLIYTIIEKLKKRLLVVDKSNLSLRDIQERINLAKSRIFDGKLDCVIIDYLQYMKHDSGGSGGKAESEFAGLSASARGMKPLAKNNDLLVICLSQLNRGSNAYTRPSMSALKGSGDIEATGDLIGMMWKPSLDPDMSAIDKGLLKNTLMYGIAKTRRGVIADEFELKVDSSKTRIREAEKVA